VKLGVVFPTREIRTQAAEVVEYARGVEAAGFDHILAYEHVLGADRDLHPGWEKYDHTDTFHEPFVLFGFLAGVCSLDFVTGVLVLPQRQTALVAKQAAELDWLSGGRLRLGVGVGWNALEYEALGVPFPERGNRVEEQIEVLRSLWSSESVVFDGAFHRVPGMGIAPRPVQRPIPIWIGSATMDPAVARAGRLADGWIPLGRPGQEMEEALDRLREAAAAAGRDPARIGLEPRVEFGDGDLLRIRDEINAWHDCGASHLAFSTMDAGLADVRAHLGALTSMLGMTQHLPDSERPA
jgi:probable F420-dependent oxidoreductase